MPHPGLCRGCKNFECILDATEDNIHYWVAEADTWFRNHKLFLPVPKCRRSKEHKDPAAQWYAEIDNGTALGSGGFRGAGEVAFRGRRDQLRRAPDSPEFDDFRPGTVAATADVALVGEPASLASSSSFGVDPLPLELSVTLPPVRTGARGQEKG
jgi:hypothetical protein